MTMTPYQAAKAYMACKLHFQSEKYDIFKYRGRTSLSREAFEKRKDRYRLEKMARDMKDDEIVQYFVANFSRKPDYAGLFDDQSDTRFKQWESYNQSLSYNFGNEVKQLFEVAQEDGMCYNDVFFSSDGQHPPVLLAYMGKQISIETFIILDRLNSFTEKMVGDVVTEGILRTARKYGPFLKVDLEVYGNITQRIREQCFS
jgi:hypothetical protein